MPREEIKRKVHILRQTRSSGETLEVGKEYSLPESKANFLIAKRKACDPKNAPAKGGRPKKGAGGSGDDKPPQE